MNRTTWMQIRLSEEEKKLFVKAAKKRKLPLSNWVRAICKAEASTEKFLNKYGYQSMDHLRESVKKEGTPNAKKKS